MCGLFVVYGISPTRLPSLPWQLLPEAKPPSPSTPHCSWTWKTPRLGAQGRVFVCCQLCPGRLPLGWGACMYFSWGAGGGGPLWCRGCIEAQASVHGRLSSRLLSLRHTKALHRTLSGLAAPGPAPQVFPFSPIALKLRDPLLGAECQGVSQASLHWPGRRSSHVHLHLHFYLLPSFASHDCSISVRGS